MKALGHTFVAKEIFGESVLAVQGALLPEMVPYLARDIFEWSELHEGGEKLHEFLQKEEPESLDLSLGLLSHGITYGADKLNDKEWRGGKGYAHQRAERLVYLMNDIHGPISPKIALGWAHNYIELGLDLQIQENFPEVLQLAQAAVKEIEIDKIAEILAGCFGKDERKIAAALKILFGEIYTSENLTTVDGLARIWQGLSSRLPEMVQPMNLERGQIAIRKAKLLVEPDFREFLQEVVEDVRKNLRTAGFI